MGHQNHQLVCTAVAAASVLFAASDGSAGDSGVGAQHAPVLHGGNLADFAQDVRGRTWPHGSARQSDDSADPLGAVSLAHEESAGLTWHDGAMERDLGWASGEMTPGLADLERLASGIGPAVPADLDSPAAGFGDTWLSFGNGVGMPAGLIDSTGATKVEVSTIPLPSAGALSGAALLAFGVGRRRR